MQGSGSRVNKHSVLGINLKPRKIDPKSSREALKREKLRRLMKKALDCMAKDESNLSNRAMVYHNLIVKEDLIIPGFDQLEIEVSTQSSCPDYAWFEGSESIKGAYIAPGIVIKGKGLVIISVATQSDCIIPKNTTIGRCREIPIDLLPAIDRYLEEYPEILARKRLEKQINNLGSLKSVPKSYGIANDPEILPSVQSEREFLHKLEQSPKELRKCLIPFKSLFLREDPGSKFIYMDTPPTALGIRPNAPAILRPSYSRSFGVEESEFLTTWVTLNEKSGMIRRSSSTISSPVLLVKKPKGGFRVVIDVRKVNKSCIEPISTVIPDILTPFRRLGHKLWFTTIDISNAFHRQRLIENHKKYTAFTIPCGPKRGIYEFNSLAQGLNSSPGIFTDVIQKILQNLPPDICYQYVDDILIASNSLEEHKTHLGLVLSRLLSYNLKLDINKSFFGQKKIEYLGLEVGNGTVKTVASRTLSLDKLEVPKLGRTETKAWQRLLGLTGYYRRFVKDYASKEAQLKEIRDTCLEKTTSRQEIQILKGKAYLILESIISSIKSSILACPAPMSELIITTDASSYGSGYVTQTAAKQPITFGSGLWSKTERLMSIFEKELTSVLRAIRKCQPYFSICKSCKVYCDNIASIINLNTLNPISVSVKAIKMVLEIQSRTRNSNVTFTHISGIRNVVSDALSRMEPTQVNMFSVGMVSTRSDDKLFEFLSTVHSSNHIGIPRLMLAAREHGFKGSKIKILSEKVVDSCRVCRVEKRLLSNKVIGHTETPQREMQELHVDHVYMTRSHDGHAYLFTCKDPFSKFCWAVPVKSLAMSEVKPILSCIFESFPTISRLRGDLAFQCETIRALCKIHCVEFLANASFNSRQNSVERSHSTLRSLISKFTLEGDNDRDNWEPKVVQAIKSINTSPNQTTGVSPYSLVFHTLFDFGAKSNVSGEIEETRKKVFDKIETAKHVISCEMENIPKVYPGQIIKSDILTQVKVSL